MQIQQFAVVFQMSKSKTKRYIASRISVQNTNRNFSQKAQVQMKESGPNLSFLGLDKKLKFYGQDSKLQKVLN